MNSIIEKFFALVKYALNTKDSMPAIAHDEWPLLFKLAEQQAIQGLLWGKIAKLKDNNIGIPREILLSWFALAEQIKLHNAVLNQLCVELVEKLHTDGFRCCLLKGQGNATYYSVPELRNPGDIDVWVKAKEDVKCNKEDIIRYAKKQNPKAEVRLYHVEYEWKGVPVELHFMPGIMNNPFYNLRLQQWYNKMADEECTLATLPDGIGNIPVPTVGFNLVYQLAHMMHHFFDEGIGLRQMIDYYYLLRKGHNEGLMVQGFIESITKTLKYLNLYQFAGAVMYIMKKVFGLEESFLLVPIDERRGKTLLNEILKGGNFGHYSGLDQHNAAKKYFQKTFRNLILVKEYPAEALCEPVFRVYHWFWRLTHLVY